MKDRDWAYVTHTESNICLWYIQIYTDPNHRKQMKINQINLVKIRILRPENTTKQKQKIF